MNTVESLVRRLLTEVRDASHDELDPAKIRPIFDELMEFACASADDDLADCAGEGLGFCKELAAAGDGQAETLAQLREFISRMALAYEVATVGNPPPEPTPLADLPVPTGGTGLLPPQVQEPQPAASAVPPRQPTSVVPLAAVPDGPVMLQGVEQPARIASHPPERDPEILAEFLLEAREHLGEAEGHLLALDQGDGDRNALSALFRGFHSIKGVAGFLDLAHVERTAHAAEDLLALSRDQGGKLPAGASDAIFEAIDVLKRAVGAIGEAFERGTPIPTQEAAAPALILRIEQLCRGAEHACSDGDTGAQQDPPGVPIGGAHASPERAPSEPPSSAASPTKRNPKPGVPRARRETIRVDAERLDLLVDMIGELVITESMVTRGVSDQLPRSLLSRHLNRMEKIVREVHELAGSLRMVPVGATFRKMARLARDVARKSNKDVRFAVEGEDAELDKTVVDGIGDPLVHLVRNAIDHGLEMTSEDRTRSGKSGQGTVTLRALHRGGCIHIEVEDDGRGLDPQKILERAKAKGIVSGDEPLSESEIIGLICQPGFSTAERVTSISGRGVGMDVVRQQLKAMNGSLEVRSVLGQGTCFTMQLPLTLAVIDGMVTRIGRERFIIPTLSIVRLVQCFDTHITTIAGRGEVLQLDDRLIPVVRPTAVFGFGLENDDHMAVVLEFDGGWVALLIDELIGQQQVVIKSLGEGLGEVPGLAGCAILPDGRVGMVLDVAGIMRRAEQSVRDPALEAM